MAQARQIAGDRAEDEIVRRGIEDFDHAIIYEGRITESYRTFSDQLGDVLLEGMRLDPYRPAITTLNYSDEDHWTWQRFLPFADISA